MDLESRIINKIDNAENSKLLSLCLVARRSSLVSQQFESISSSQYSHTSEWDEADLIIGLFIYEIRVVTRELMIERRTGGRCGVEHHIHFI